MPHLTPISRANFIKKLITLGYEGPFSGGKHQFLIKGKIRLTIPKPTKKK
jgi:predicted RNA binding protein YcfA (HicA-like mRNA interferase family)